MAAEDMAAEEFSVVELEAKLRADSSGDLLTEVTGHLTTVRADVKRVIDAGLPPAEFDRMQRIHHGLERAAAVLEDVWASLHRR